MLLKTERLWLLPTPLDVYKRRRHETDFTHLFRIEDTDVSVHFPEEWPGDLLSHLPDVIAYREENSDEIDWGGTIILSEERIAIGQIGTVGAPDADGRFEIGYGLNPTFHNKGHGTEIVGAFSRWLLAQEGVTSVMADTASDNPASARVLEKCGFVCVGTGWSEEDGDLLFWRLPVLDDRVSSETPSNQGI